MTINSMKQERIDVYKDTIHFNNKKRIINFANVWLWMVSDGGYKINKIARDYEMRAKMVEDFHNRYNFDMYADLWTRNPLLISDAMEYSMYNINDEKCSVNIKDFSFFEKNDYPLASRDYRELIWTKILPKKYKNLNDSDAKDSVKKGFIEWTKYNKYCTDIYKFMSDKYGILTMAGNPGTTKVVPFMEVMMSMFLGIKGTSLALRRDYEDMKQLCDKYGVLALDNADKTMGSIPTEANDLSLVILAHTILNNKQYEELYYPQLKKIFDWVLKYDKIVHVFIEGSAARIWNYLQEAPKGHVLYQFEVDSIFEGKKQLGNIAAVCGGVTTDMLYSATPQQNVDHVKRLFDEVGYDGAFVLSQNKMLSFPTDAKRENFLAINKFVENYKF